jgi:alpha-glucosidase (family GH31 glycosyl hydrolase)
MTTLPQFNFRSEPLPDPAAVVTVPQARFTVLEARLIRMEYSPTGQFENRASQAFWFRYQPVPEYRVQRSADLLQIETEQLSLRYRISPAGFTHSSLAVTVKSTGKTWRFGDPPSKGENLGGTIRTLDGVRGHVHLDPGLMGRAGWAVVDDSDSLVFSDDGWLTPRAAPDNLDLYLFGFGHAYADCLKVFTRVAGLVPLIPRWVLGNWWSRYWAYSDQELLALMDEFHSHRVPLAVCIVDMDWHITETGNDSTGWTGYTWNRALFPDPPGFLSRLHALGLKTALNLHPAEGVHNHEAQYAAFAAALGQDPQTGEPVPFDCADPRFINAYFELLHHPLEAQGVDFWWLDWQQGTRSRIHGLDPLWWLNHLHFLDHGRDGQRRPLLFSRWGGLGSHRYPIGFSGDTVVNWEVLDLLPGFTAAAANVGYGWWSHDIGGHMAGIEDDELYTRWVQYGVFSPILRLHSTNNPFHERRPWGRGPAAERAARGAMRLRHTLIPYIYSMAWRNHTTGLPLITPLYYSHPEEAAAYECPQVYWFGSELLAAPFTSPAHPETRLSRQTIWLPEGDWINFFTGEFLHGGGWRTIYGGLDDIPVYARPGAIVPLAPEVDWGGVENPEELRIDIFPGADNRFELYEDDGETTGYTRGVYAVTAFNLHFDDQHMTFTILPAVGDRAVLPARRTYRLRFRGVRRPAGVIMAVDGHVRPVDWEFDENDETLTFSPVRLTPGETLGVEVSAGFGGLIAPRDRTLETMQRYLSAFRLDTWVKYDIERDWPRLAAGELSLLRYAALTDAQRAALESLLWRESNTI